MNKKKSLVWWCDKAWIKYACVLSGVTFLLILLNWTKWSEEIKIIAAIAVLVPVHVLEEWVFPGGFHYQYNLVLHKSDMPNAYPMCRLSDMITNLVGTIFFIFLTVYCVFNEYAITGILLGTFIFCFMELFVHTLLGIQMYLKFKSKGKSTIYGPGSITTYWGFVPLGFVAFWNLKEATIGKTEYILCIGMLLFMLLGCIVAPEQILKRKDTLYKFNTAGYYEKFLK